MTVVTSESHKTREVGRVGLIAAFFQVGKLRLKES